MDRKMKKGHNLVDRGDGGPLPEHRPPLGVTEWTTVEAMTRIIAERTNTTKTNVSVGECSVCRRVHGREIQHACE
jgi:hypothetical protein